MSRHARSALSLAFSVLMLALSTCGIVSSAPAARVASTAPAPSTARVASTAPAPSTARVTPSAPTTVTHAAGSARWVPAAAVPATALVLIAEARHTCDVELYELGNPALVAALIADAHRGVAVHVMLDATESQSRLAASVLRAAGVPVETLTVPHGGLDHVKLLVVDGAQTLTGGVNWGVSSMDTTDADVFLPSDLRIPMALASDSDKLPPRIPISVPPRIPKMIHQAPQDVPDSGSVVAPGPGAGKTLRRDSPWIVSRWA